MRRAGIVGAALLALLALALYLGRARKAPAPDPSAPPAAGAPLPAPQSAPTRGGRDVPPGEDRVTVVGRLTDAQGRPFADLIIAGGGRRTRSGADGAFELRELARAELALDLSADFDPAQPLGERRLASGVPPLALDLRGGPARVDVGTHVLPRSQPFWIEGQVVLDPDWARSKALTLADVRIELEVPPPEELGGLLRPEVVRTPGAPVDWSRPPWRAELPAAPPRPADDGAFRFAVETPHDPFLLRVRLARLEPHERLLVPVADGRFGEAFRFP